MPQLSRRATAPVATTAAGTAGTVRPSPSCSPPTPACPPGFPHPCFADRALALALFPQIEGIIVQDPDLSQPRSARSGSSFVPDSMDEADSSGQRPVPAPSRPMVEACGAEVGRKVSFATSQLPPACPTRGIHGAPRPCLKQAKDLGFNVAPSASLRPESRIQSPLPARQETERRPDSPAVNAKGRFEGSPVCREVEASSEELWRQVRAPYWWRKSPRTYQNSRRNPSPPSPIYRGDRRPFIKPRNRKCNNCLAKGHPAAECRDPVRCRNCKGWRHRARECKAKKQGRREDSPSSSSSCDPASSTSSRSGSPPVHSTSTAATTTPSAASPTASPAAVPTAPTTLRAAAMAPRVGDPSLRPAQGHVIIPITQEVARQAALLSSQAVFVWLGGNRPQVNAEQIKEAIVSYARINPDYVKVVPHYPEDFLATFDYPHHRKIITDAPGRFEQSGLDIHAVNWRSMAHAD
ncbi:hypothetical protein QYE76_068053 [Lolium multiflorum]|uniref:CCHC-type domain-containing protein n=1 Tax=Lolium multiflorum TaxID=4521 RepID=A0AAD8SFH8_LOLMU|nr:hypothetical protein QYE76_068053 [Lolium multiflorum]